MVECYPAWLPQETGVPGPPLKEAEERFPNLCRGMVEEETEAGEWLAAGILTSWDLHMSSDPRTLLARSGRHGPGAECVCPKTGCTPSKLHAEYCGGEGKTPKEL